MIYVSYLKGGLSHEQEKYKEKEKGGPSQIDIWVNADKIYYSSLFYWYQSCFFIWFAGDPISDLIPIYLDVFRGDPSLLKHFLKSYKLPFRRMPQHESVEGGDKFGRLSYLAM